MADELQFSTAPGRWVIAATALGSGIAMIDATVVGDRTSHDRKELSHAARPASMGSDRVQR